MVGIVKVWWYDATAPVSLCPPIHSPPPATPFNAMQFQPIHSNYAQHRHHPGSGAYLTFTPISIRAFRFSRKSALETTIAIKTPLLESGFTSFHNHLSRLKHSGGLFIIDDGSDNKNSFQESHFCRGNLGRQEVLRRLTEPPGRRSTRSSILGPSFKTLAPLAKEPALLACYWPRSRTGRSHWSRLWVGRTACLTSPLFHQITTFSSRLLIDLQFKRQ